MPVFTNAFNEIDIGGVGEFGDGVLQLATPKTPPKHGHVYKNSFKDGYYMLNILCNTLANKI